MPKLQRLRSQAFHAQSGLCYYCGIRMWLDNPAELPQPHRAINARKCTAEHLIARCDGGRDTAENIVAACHHCNTTRHKRKKPRAAAEQRSYVVRRVGAGKWWPESVATELRASRPVSRLANRRAKVGTPERQEQTHA